MSALKTPLRSVAKFNEGPLGAASDTAGIGLSGRCCGGYYVCKEPRASGAAEFSKDGFSVRAAFREAFMP